MITDEKKQILTNFAEGRKLYKIMDFKGALNCFKKALQIDPNDGPSKVYVERCEHYIENPPPEDWDGVYVMKTK